MAARATQAHKCHLHRLPLFCILTPHSDTPLLCCVLSTLPVSTALLFNLLNSLLLSAPPLPLPTSCGPLGRALNQYLVQSENLINIC